MPDADPSSSVPAGAPRWVSFDGIVEGRIDDLEAIRKAVHDLNDLGICRFDLECDGGKFSLLPDDAQETGARFDEKGQRLLLEHLTRVAAGARGPVESTLRCTMVYDEQCAETIFRAAPPPPEGPGLSPLSRIRPRRPGDAPADTPPELPLGRRLLRREVLIAVPLLVLAFALSAWQTGLIDRLFTADAQGLRIDTGSFGGLLRVEVENSWGDYVVTIGRGPDYPDTFAAWEERDEAASTAAERLHSLVVRQGQEIYVHLVDPKGNVLAERSVDLRGLVTDAEGHIRVELPGNMTAFGVTLSVTQHEPK